MTEYIPTQDELTQTFMTLLPDGLAWSKQSSSNLYQAMFGLMGVFLDLYTSAANLPSDGFPATTIFLLPEWEASTGLPDLCAGPSPTIAQRQQQVVSRFVGLSGESVDDLELFAYNLGFTITIIESSPNFANNDYATTPLYYNANYIFVTLYQPVYYFTSGVSTTGQALDTTESYTVLECELQRVIPATATLIFTVIPV